MKKTISIIGLIAVLCVAFCMGAFAAGSSYTKELLANYVGVQLVVDGVTITPKDANGKVIEPFIVDGTTYLPVRAVAEALGKEVSWDGTTKTVYIGEKPEDNKEPATGSVGLEYSANSDGTYTVAGIGTCTDTHVVIPEVYQDAAVTGIGNSAFMDCSSLTSITIPDSVTSIGNAAFHSCISLTSITIPNSVTSIVQYAFFNCSSLTSITIPDSVTSIDRSTFYGCSSLTTIAIPDSITSIGERAFMACSNLASITIPDSVTSIGEASFAGCRSLTDITYTGTMAQWEAIVKGSSWKTGTTNYTIHCTDGDISN